MTENWIDVSYRYKEGVWKMNPATGEVRKSSLSHEHAPGHDKLEVLFPPEYVEDVAVQPAPVKTPKAKKLHHG